jgi:hypothetical protein
MNLEKKELFFKTKMLHEKGNAIDVEIKASYFIYDTKPAVQLILTVI